MKIQTCFLMVMLNLQGMEIEETVKHSKHHTKSRSGSNEFVTINILPSKKDSQEIKNDKEDRKNQLKIAAIAACSAITAAGLTAAITLTIHFTECSK